MQTLDSPSQPVWRHDVHLGRFSRPTFVANLKVLLAAADAGTTLLAAVLCGALIPTSPAGPNHAALLFIVLGSPAAWVFALTRQHLYTARRIARRPEEFRGLCHAAATVLALMTIFSYAANSPLPRPWLVALPITSVLLLCLERELARRAFVRLRRTGTMRRPVVVVGTNHEAIELAALIDADREVGYEIVGFVTDMAQDTIDESIQARVIGSVSDTPMLVEHLGAVGVVIASTAVTTAVSNRLARRLTESGIHVELTSTLRDVAVQRLTVAEIGHFPTIYVEAVRRGGWRAAAKRAFDVTAASIALVMLAPSMLILAVLVKLSSSGPALFLQTRVGLDGTPFQLVKFRTMVTDAESRLEQLAGHNEATGPLFKMVHDPRVTRVGRVLRRASLDELPQLWNVIRGEMSLVGPRPALPSETEAWHPELHERLRVKPGITGMWQVNGRSNSTFESYTRLDLYYVDNWSLLTDLSILVKTVPTVLARRGAF